MHDFDAMDETATAVIENSPDEAPERPPLMVRKPGGLRIGATHYPNGSLVPFPELAHCRNYLVLKSSGQLVDPPPGYVTNAKPILVTETATRTPNAPVEIVHDSDPVLSWKKTVDAMAAKMGGDVERVKCLLMADVHGARLCRAAIRTDAERRAIRDRTVGRREVAAP